jgi:hypothetical protein
MLSAHTFLPRDGVEIADVACRHERGRGLIDEQAHLPRGRRSGSAGKLD